MIVRLKTAYTAITKKIDPTTIYKPPQKKTMYQEMLQRATTIRDELYRMKKSTEKLWQEMYKLEEQISQLNSKP